MNVINTKIKDCYIIQTDCFEDQRGDFSRAFCKKTLESYGINADFVQSNISSNKNKFTLRGLHSQDAPFGEDKLVTCTRGKILDVCVDVTKNSPTYRQYVAVELTEHNRTSLYVPKGCAHGYLTIEDNSQVIYFVTCEYTPESEHCYRYDDPAFNIEWGVNPDDLIVSEKDKKHKLIEE